MCTSCSCSSLSFCFLFFTSGPWKSSGVPGDPPQHTGGEEAVSNVCLNGLTAALLSFFFSLSAVYFFLWGPVWSMLSSIILSSYSNMSFSLVFTQLREDKWVFSGSENGSCKCCFAIILIVFTDSIELHLNYHWHVLFLFLENSFV